uniref:EGF-like domain-containing protein n=1 Tax=Ciona savignyi TaxID=51511 RepID=H2YSH5_CIOSA
YHRCLCNQGYSLSANNATCSDINECEGGSGGCSEGCINSIGSFWCFCQHNGYQLDRDNKTCIDTNECETNNGNCEHICTNTNGSYTCGCDAGYQFNGTHGCSDIDECAFANGNCSQQCVNQPGSYHCECQANFKLDTDNKTCIHCPTCSEFESVAADVANFKSKAVVIEQLINRNIRLSATVASLEDRIARIEASLNLEALPANEHP